MLIRPINESDNKHIAVILRQVLIEMDIPRKGSAFEDPEIDKMYESYQSNRSIYFVVEENDKILGGAGINPLKDGDSDICELQKMYFHKSLRGRGIGTLLYREFLLVAKDRGVNRVEWSVLDWNKTAIDFYKKSGAIVDGLEQWKIVRMDKQIIEKYLST